MTYIQLQILALAKLNDPNGTYYAAAGGAVNEGQRRFVFETLCLETSGPLALTPATLSYSLLATLADFLAPLRIYNSSGARLRPSSIAELEALDSGWMNRPGTPARYVWRGLDWLAVYPQPPGADALTVYYANAPAPLVLDTDTPQIRAASQYALANWAAWALRLPEGGQELAKFGLYRAEYSAEAAAVRALVKDRNKDSDYERMAFERTRVKR